MYLYNALDCLCSLYEVCSNSCELSSQNVFYLDGNCTYHPESTPFLLILPIFKAVLECLFQYHLQVCSFHFVSCVVNIFTLSKWISAWGTGKIPAGARSVKQDGCTMTSSHICEKINTNNNVQWSITLVEYLALFPMIWPFYYLLILANILRHPDTTPC